MSWRQRLITSAANDTPTTSGESSDDWLVRVRGNFWSEAQVWQESDTRVMAVLISRAKKWLCTTIWSWCLEGWSNLRWRAVSNPS